MTQKEPSTGQKVLSSYLAELETKPKKRHRKKRDKKVWGPAEDTSAARFLAGAPVDNKALERDRSLAATYHMHDILLLLEKRAEEGLRPCSEEDIEKELKIKFKDYPKLAKNLQSNPRVQYEDRLYSWRGNLESLITDKNELLDVLKRVRYLKSSDLKGCYKGCDKDLKAFIESEDIGEFRADSQHEKLYFYYDPDLKKIGETVKPEFRALWHETLIPSSRVEKEEKLRSFQIDPLEVVKPLEIEQDEETGIVQRKRRSGKRKWLNQEIMDEMDGAG